ncbi:MAG: gamma carbonic anhydrase family protein [Bacteriovorax sp.]|jgi:carbonic anhydrase/acetyltransferase-like protein (isoleucine patch superfamily)
MPLYSFKGIKPELGTGVFIAPSADIIGKVILGENASIWHQCVARGDINWIRVGNNTNVQDLTMLHVTNEFSLTIGSEVSIGHNAILHGCTIGNNCLIGMGAIILDGATIGDNCVVAAGSVVPPGKSFPEGSMIMGNPAVLKRQLKPEERKLYGNHYKSYISNKDDYLDPDFVKLL